MDIPDFPEHLPPAWRGEYELALYANTATGLIFEQAEFKAMSSVQEAMRTYFGMPQPAGGE